MPMPTRTSVFRLHACGGACVAASDSPSEEVALASGPLQLRCSPACPTRCHGPSSTDTDAHANAHAPEEREEQHIAPLSALVCAERGSPCELLPALLLGSLQQLDLLQAAAQAPHRIQDVVVTQPVVRHQCLVRELERLVRGKNRQLGLGNLQDLRNLRPNRGTAQVVRCVADRGLGFGRDAQGRVRRRARPGSMRNRFSVVGSAWRRRLPRSWSRHPQRARWATPGKCLTRVRMLANDWLGSQSRKIVSCWRLTRRYSALEAAMGRPQPLGDEGAQEYTCAGSAVSRAGGAASASAVLGPGHGAQLRVWQRWPGRELAISPASASSRATCPSSASGGSHCLPAAAQVTGVRGDRCENLHRRPRQ